jgi:hypothetical protein
MSEERITKRDIINKTRYVASVFFAVPGSVSFALAGSGGYSVDTTTENNTRRTGF